MGEALRNGRLARKGWHCPRAWQRCLQSEGKGSTGGWGAGNKLLRGWVSEEVERCGQGFWEGLEVGLGHACTGRAGGPGDGLGVRCVGETFLKGSQDSGLALGWAAVLLMRQNTGRPLFLGSGEGLASGAGCVDVRSL